MSAPRHPLVRLAPALAAAWAMAGCPAGGAPADDVDGGSIGTTRDGGASLAPIDGGVVDDAGAGVGVTDAGDVNDDDGGVDEIDAGSVDEADAGAVDDAGSPSDGGLAEPPDGGPAADGGSTEASTGELSFITYNVAGLPQGISGSDPADFMPLIGPLLNDYDLAVVQEDFWYHEELSAGVELPYQSAPSVAEPTLIPVNIGDGLNRFSRYPLGALARTEWAECNGWTECSNDCPSEKGYSVSEVELAPGVVVDVYNLHMDAGSCDGDFEARAAGAEELIAEIAARSAGRAIIVAGDTNLSLSRPRDVEILDGLLADTGLEIACRLKACDDESIDRIMIRSGDDVALEVVEWARPTHFVDDSGTDLSDHLPTTALLRWTATP